MTNLKLYPFNIGRHGHDLEFRKNRFRNIMHDMEHGDIPMHGEKYDIMEYLVDRINDILGYQTRNGIAFLPGKLCGIAKESVIWATETRAETQDRNHMAV
jgi:hypothetical protein